MATQHSTGVRTQDSRRAVLAKLSELEQTHARTYEELVALRLQAEDFWAFRPGQIRELSGVLTDLAVAMQTVRIVALRGRRALR